jgi:nucleotide-binding universal stress UspA family protein
MIALSDILVATDFSEPSAAALRYGCALARHFKSTLHVMHAVALAPSVLTGAGAYVVSVPDLQRQIEEAARKELDELPIENDEPLAVQRVVIASNAPAAAIVDYAKHKHIGLIVTGTHGRGAVAHALIGSVAERVVWTAPCPVLTVRCPEQEFIQEGSTRC